MVQLILALLFSVIPAHAADDESAQLAMNPQQIRWGIGSFNSVVATSSPYASVGIAFSVAAPISEKYWVEGLGRSMTIKGGDEGNVILALKRNFNLTAHFELSAAVGPEYVHSRDLDYNGGYFALTGLATGTYWLNERWGISIVPSYQLTFRPQAESSVGGSLMLVYGR